MNKPRRVIKSIEQRGDGYVVQHVELEATLLRDGRYAVRPKGRCGTCGFSPVPWTVQFVRARSPEEAIAKAERVEDRKGIV